MLIAASFRPASDICATIISLIFSDTRHLRVGSYGFVTGLFLSNENTIGPAIDLLALVLREASRDR